MCLTTLVLNASCKIALKNATLTVLETSSLKYIHGHKDKFEQHAPWAYKRNCFTASFLSTIVLPAQALHPPTSATLQMQTNAPSAYGRHTVAKSIFSFTKIRSALIKKIPVFHYWQHWITLRCLWNGQYHFKNRAAVPGRHVSQHTYMHDCTHTPDATQSMSLCGTAVLLDTQQQLRGIRSSLLLYYDNVPVMIIREGRNPGEEK